MDRTLLIALWTVSGAVLCAAQYADHCNITVDQRIYVQAASGAECEANYYCFDDSEQDPDKICYLRDDDDCFVQRDERATVSRDDEDDCRKIGGCWDDRINTHDEKCYFKDRLCKIRPSNCDVVGRSECVVGLGRTCGVGRFRETWLCYDVDDDGNRVMDDEPELVVVPRFCCMERCAPGGGGPPPAIPCFRVWPRCESDGSSSSGGDDDVMATPYVQ